MCIYDIFCPSENILSIAVNPHQFVVLPPAGAQNMISCVDQRKPCRRRRSKSISVVFQRPKLFTKKNFFLCAVPSYLQILDSRTPRRERQVYKFPTPLATISSWRRVNTHTTPRTHMHTHKYAPHWHHTGTTPGYYSVLRTKVCTHAHAPNDPATAPKAAVVGAGHSQKGACAPRGKGWEGSDGRGLADGR